MLMKDTKSIMEKNIGHFACVRWCLECPMIKMQIVTKGESESIVHGNLKIDVAHFFEIKIPYITPIF